MFRFSLLGVILVALGVVLLLNNLGVLPWGVWRTLWRFWPVILVLIGLNILWGGRSPWLILLITVVVLAGVVALAVRVHALSPEAAPVSFSQSLQGVERAEIEVEFGAGDLLVGSLPPKSAQLVEGTARPSVEQEFRVRRGTGELKLRVPGRQPFWRAGDQGPRLEAMLSTGVPLDLTVRAGAANVRLDLGSLKVNRLLIETGASRIAVDLPSAGSTEATVKAGAAQVNISVPRGVAARITTEGGLSSFDVDTSRFPKADGGFESPGFSTAVNRVEIRVESGVSSVSIR